jgi:hypothetical protein
MASTKLCWQRSQRVVMHAERAMVPPGTLGRVVGIFSEIGVLAVWFDGRVIYDLVRMDAVVAAEEASSSAASERVLPRDAGNE